MDRDPHVARAAWYLARAIRRAFVVAAYSGGTVSDAQLENFLKVANGGEAMWEQALAGADDAADPTPTATVWGVQAWVVCGSSP